MGTIILIPSRMQSTRFPNKPLVDIMGKTMIERVYTQAVKSNMGGVWVACCDQEVYDKVIDFGGNAIFTDNFLPSGTDRIYQGLERLKLKDRSFSCDYVLNLQGDLPTISVDVIKRVLECLYGGSDITTACSKITRYDDLSNSNVVKVYADFTNSNVSKVLDFSREALGMEPFYHHIGIYGYRVDILKRFVSLPISIREQHYKLEQLRALDNGMIIDVCLVDDIPLGIDTKEDLEYCLEILQKD